MPMHARSLPTQRRTTSGVLTLATLLLALGSHPPVAAQAAAIPPRFAAFDAFIARSLKDYRVPGAAVAVVENGRIVFVKGYGVSDIAKATKVDGNTVFQIASLSKAFAGVAAAVMVDKGGLKWDTPIVTYLPQFAAYDPYVTRNLTMRDLLAHRTGWPKFTGDLLGDFYHSRADVLARARYLKPAYSFREVAQYSNLGYFVAGEVTAKQAGASWDDVVKNRVFGPLAMTHSSTSLGALPARNVALPYAIIGGVLRSTTRSNSDVMASAGGVNSTATDMAHLLQFYLNKGAYHGVLVKPATVAEIFKRSMVSDVDFTEMPPISESTGYYYGMGIDSYDYAGHHVIEKGGALSGFRTVFTMLPDKRAGIVILSNLNLTTFPEAVRAYYLEKMLLGRSPDADLKEIAKRNASIVAMFKPLTPPANPAPFRGKPEDLAGTYENELYGRCTISTRPAGMNIACGTTRYSAPLVHWTSNTFLARWPGATSLGDDVTFTLGPTGIADSFKDDPLGDFTRVSTP